MNAVEFLRYLFPADTPGFIRIVYVLEGRWPGTTKWLSAEELHALDDLMIPTEYDVYFTPHPYLQKTTADKQNAYPKAQVVWMDCDDVGWAPWMVQEATPSFVVESSPKKYHAYWLLDNLYNSKDVEIVNKQLHYHYLKRDRSGWDLSQLLRVPSFISHKYNGKPFKVDILDAWCKPEHRIDLKRFDSLPTVHVDFTDSVDSEPPDLSTLISYPDLLAKYARVLTPQIKHNVELVAKDRSRALWSLYHQTKRVGMEVEETYVMARESVNNKFKDQKYNGDRQLWRDVSAAFACTEFEDGIHVLEKLDEIRYKATKLKAEERKQAVAEVIYEDLFTKGRFFKSTPTREAFYYRNKVVYPLTPRSDLISTLLDLHYEVNAATRMFDYVVSHLRTHCLGLGIEILIKDRVYYDSNTGVLFVSNHAGDAWRLDGDSIRLVENCFANGVFFRPEQGCDKFEPVFEESDDDLLNEHLFNRSRFDPAVLEPDDARFLVRAWTCALFFPEIMDTRPILVIEGPKGSGKTTLFKTLEWFLAGQTSTVTEMPQDADEFKETIRNKTYTFFDGVDLTFKGLRNLLSTAATGTIQVKRRLYTDDEMVRHYLKCFVGITTMEAKFFRDDVADRSIPLKVVRLPHNRSESELKQELIVNRNKIWGQLLCKLNCLVKELGKPEYNSLSYTFRMADFAKVMHALCAVEGRDTMKYITYLKRAQTSEILEKDPVWEMISMWIENPKNVGRKLKAKELHRELYALSVREGTTYTRSVSTARKLFFAIKRLMPELQNMFVIGMDKPGGDTQYDLSFIPKDKAFHEPEAA